MKRLVHPLFILCCHAIAFGENSDLEDNEMVNPSCSSEVCSEPLSCTPCDLFCAPYEQSNPLVCNSCGTWEVEIDALYWRTSTTQKIYALTESLEEFPHVIDDYSEVKPRNDWGVHGNVNYFFPCSSLFIGADYTFFRQKLSDSTSHPTTVTYISPILNFINFVKATVTDEYQRAGGRIGYRFFDSCCGYWYGFGGIDWLYLKEEEKLNAVNFVNQPENLKQKKTFSSAAFFLGSGGKCYFLRNFGFAGEVDVVAAIGSRKTSFHTNILANTSVTNKIQNATIVVPGIDLNLELFYEWPCQRVSYLFAIGYEQHYFFNPLLGNRLFLGPDNNLIPSQFTDIQNIGFGGLYLSAKVLF